MSVYYIDNGGSDSNNGLSTGAPWQTFAHAVPLLVGGDILNVMDAGGNYTGTSNLIDYTRITVPSGSAGNLITIQANSGDTPVLQPPDGLSSIKFSGQHHWAFSGAITIDGSLGSTDTGQALVFAWQAAHDITFDGLRVTASPNFGVGWDYDCSNMEWIGGRVDHCGVGTDPINGHAFYILNGIVRGCEIDNNKGYGIHANSHDYITGPTCYQNDIHHNGRTGQPSYGMVSRLLNATQFYNNIITYQLGGGILVYSGSTATLIQHNTIAYCRDEAVRMEYYASAPIVRNNLSRSNGSDYVNAGGTGTPVTDHNWSSSDGDPLFTSSTDFHIPVTSPAKSGGASILVTGITTDYDDVARPQNVTPAYGAYEASSTGGGGGGASPTFVDAQEGGPTTSTTTVASAAAAHAAGRLLIAFVINSDSTVPSGVANTAGDTWTRLSGAGGANGATTSRVQGGSTFYAEIWYVASTAGHAADVVTATFGSSVSEAHIVVHQVSYSGTLSLDTNDKATATGATSVTKNITTTADNTYVAALATTSGDTRPFVEGSGLTLRLLHYFFHQTEDRNDAAAGAVTVAMSGANSVDWAITIAAFKTTGGTRTITASAAVSTWTFPTGAFTGTAPALSAAVSMWVVPTTGTLIRLDQAVPVGFTLADARAGIAEAGRTRAGYLA